MPTLPPWRIIGADPPKLEDVSSINDPLEIIFKSPADVDDVCNDKLPANRSILSAAASWMSAVVAAADPDNCNEDCPARRRTDEFPITSKIPRGPVVPMPTLPPCRMIGADPLNLKMYQVLTIL